MRVGDIIPAAGAAVMPEERIGHQGEIWVATGAGSFRCEALDDGSLRVVETTSAALDLPGCGK